MPKLLVYTFQNTGQGGFDHGTDGAAQSMFNDFAAADNFTVVYDDNGSEFDNLSNLQTYDAIWFCNTSGDSILSPARESNLQAYVAAGGNIGGNHAATDTNRHSSAQFGGGTGSDYYAQLMGGSRGVPAHTPGVQSGTFFQVGNHPTTANLPFSGGEFTRSEEIYKWENGYLNNGGDSPLVGGIQSVLGVRSTGGDSHDAERVHSWVANTNGGGRVFYTAMGHESSYYTGDSIMRQHIQDAVQWLFNTSTNSAMITSEYKRLHKVQFDWNAVATSESVATFQDYRLDVTITAPSGQVIVVPGFYAADGNAAETSASSGDVWRCLFTPKEVGQYSYSVSFKTGSMAAIGTGGSSAGSPDGETGNFTINETDKNFPDFRARGIVEYVGKWNLVESYTGKALLKSELGSPENIFDYGDVDNTYDTGGQNTPGLTNGLHSYAATAGFEPAGSNKWQGNKGATLFGVLGYLNSIDVNSVYAVMFGTEGGDGGATWPWQDPNGNKFVYDVSKLEQWARIIEAANELGIQWQYFFNEAENDSVLSNDERRIYYREIAARFGYLPAIQWNLGEETSQQGNIPTYATWLNQYLQHDQNVTWHTKYNVGAGAADGLKNDPNTHGVSVQGHYDTGNSFMHDIRNQGGKPRIINFDEQTPELQQGNSASNRETKRNNWWWNVTGGGSGGAVYYGGNSTDWGDQALDSINQAASANMLVQYGRFWRFYYDNNLDTDNFIPDLSHSLISGGGSTGNTLHYKQGSHYVAYLPNGGTQTVDLSGDSGTFNVKWFDPRNGGISTGSVTQVQAGSTVSVGSPPNNTGSDWVLWLESTSGNPPGGGCSGNVDCNNVDFIDDGTGIVVIPVGDLQLSGDWSLNASGSLPPATNYATWNKGGSNSIGTPADPIDARFAVCQDGNYQVSVFMHQDPDQPDISEGNDYYLKVVTPQANQWRAIHSVNPGGMPDIYPGGSGLTPNPAGDSGVNGFFKGFHNTGSGWDKLTQVSEGTNQWEYRPTVVAIADEIYTLQVAGRSYGTNIDKVVIWDTSRYTYSQVLQSLNATLCSATGNNPPTLSNIPNQSTAQNSTVNLQVVATDPDGDDITFSANGLPAGLSINPNNGLISGTAIAQVGPYQVTVTATDNGSPNLSSSKSFTWNITTGGNNPPVIQTIPDQTNNQGDVVSLQVVASDPDGNSLTYGQDNLPAGLTINSSTGEISGTIISTPGVFIVVITVIDSGTPEQSASTSFIWTVNQGTGNPTDGFFLEYSLDGGNTWTEQGQGFNSASTNSSNAQTHAYQRRVCTFLQDGTKCCGPIEMIDYPPEVQDGAVTTEFETAVTFDLSTIAVDPLGGALTFEIVSGSNNGTSQISGNNLNYTPDSGFSGGDLVTLTATNGRGETSDTFTVAITVEEDGGPTTDAVVEITGISESGSPWTIEMCQQATSTQLNCNLFRIRVERGGSEIWTSWPNLGFSGCDVQQMNYANGGGTYGDSGSDVVAQSGDVVFLEGTVDGWVTYDTDTFTVS